MSGNLGQVVAHRDVLLNAGGGEGAVHGGGKVVMVFKEVNGCFL